MGARRGTVPGTRDRRPAVRTLVATAALFAGLAAVSFLYDPYQEQPERRLADVNFDAGMPGAADETGEWRRSRTRVSWVDGDGFEGSGGVRIVVTEGRGAFLERSIREPRRFEALRVRAKLRLIDYVPREDGYSGARWVLFFRNPEGKPMWGHPHAVCVESEATGGTWIDCQGTFDVPANAVSGHVRAQIVARRGTLLVDDLEILPATPKPSRFAWLALLVGLSLLAAGQALRWLRPWRHPLGRLQLALGALIIFGTLCPTWALQDAVALARETGRALERRWTVDPPGGHVSGEVRDREPAAASKTTGKPPAEQEPEAAGGDTRPAPESAPRPSAPQPKGPASSASEPDEPTERPRPSEAAPDRAAPRSSSGGSDGAGEAGAAGSPGDEQDGGGGLTAWLGRAAGQARRWLTGEHVVTLAKRVGHAALFFLLGLLTFADLWRSGGAGRTRAWCERTAALAVFAAATEMLQLLAPTREPTVRDWLLDLAGIAAALLVCFVTGRVVGAALTRRRRLRT